MNASDLRGIIGVRNILVAYTVIILVVTYSPIAMVILFSFNSGASVTFPFEGFSTIWYSVLFSDQQALNALLRSLELAVGVMIATTMLCVTTSLALRRNFVGKDIVFYMVMTGIIVPGILYGLGSAFLYKLVFRTELSLWTALPIHVVYALPFGILLTLARFDPLLADYESAARTLGASGLKVFRTITFPLISNQLLAAALFGFTLSFGELMRSLFVVGGSPTLPIQVFSIVGAEGLRPNFDALGAIISFMSFVVIVILAVSLGRTIGKK